MQRLIDILCHPRRLGIYNKDKTYIPLIYLLSFFLLFMGIVMIINFNTEYYSADTSSGIIHVIDISNEDVYGEYIDNEFHFNNKRNEIKTDDMIIYFNHNDVDTSINTISKTIINFKSENVVIYYGLSQKVSYKYSSYDIDDFSLTGVCEGDIKDIVAFKDLLNNIFFDFNSKYQVSTIAPLFMQYIMQFLMVFVFALIFSFFVNPGIKFQVRFKLLIYDSIIYLFVMMLAVMIQISWLEYIAYALPIIFAGITFSHIIRISKIVK